MSSLSALAAQRVIITVPFPEWARRFHERGEEVLFHYGRPFHLAMCSGPHGSEMAFEDHPGRWLRTANETISPGDGSSIVLVDAEAVRAHRAAHLDKLLAENPREWKRLESWFWHGAAYCYARLKDGSLLPINRDYRPLQAPPGEFGSYEDFAPDAEQFTCDPRAMEGIWARVHEDGARAYLYDDDPASRAGYFSRLAKLDQHATLPGEAATENRK